MCATVPPPTDYFVCLVSPRIYFYLHSLLHLHHSIMHCPPLIHWMKCHLQKDHSHYYHPWLIFPLTKVALIFLLPSSWLTVNDHTQCTANRDASILIVASCDHTEPFSHTNTHKQK